MTGEAETQVVAEDVSQSQGSAVESAEVFAPQETLTDPQQAARTIVRQPPDGGEIILQAAAGQEYDLRIDPQAARVRVLDANDDRRLDLVLVFNAATERESRIVFLDMVEVADSDQPPVLQIAGAVVGADILVSQALALAEQAPALATAAEATAEPGHGANVYDDDLGEVDPLLAPEGPIPGVVTDFPQSEPSEEEQELLGAAASRPGLLVVGSNADDEQGQEVTHRVANPNEDDRGEILGSDDKDVLVGDPGGVELSGRFNVAIAVDVTGSIGPEDIETLNAAVKSLVQDIIDADIADQTTLHLITFAFVPRGEQAIPGVEFSKTFEWDGTEFVAADSQALTEAIDAEVTDPRANTDFEAPLQNAADFFNGLNGGTGPAADDVNRLFFMTDGIDNSGIGGNFDPDRVPDIYGPTGLIAEDGLEINVVGIQSSGGLNSGFDPNQINLLDDGLPPQPGEALHVGDPAPINQVEADIIVVGFDDLEVALSESLILSLTDVGADVINGRDGPDVIFGDVPNTDALVMDAGLDLPPGSGWEAFEQLESGVAAAPFDTWMRADTFAYLCDMDNWADLIVDGRGEGDVINAGPGDDVIFGQGGDDTMTGGPGADTFGFNLGADEGSDGIADFDGSEDRLLLFDVVDGPGDDIEDVDDMVTEIVNDGPGGDVTVNFNNGTSITFAGAGSASAIDSLADIVNDPSQILIAGA